MNPKYEILFSPTKIGSVEIKNRFVMSAMESTGAAVLVLPVRVFPMLLLRRLLVRSSVRYFSQ